MTTATALDGASMKRLLPVVALLLLACLWAGGVARGQSPGAMPGVEQYWQQVEATRAVVAGLDDLNAGQQHARLTAEAERFSAIEAVVLPGNVAVAIDHANLIDALTAAPPDVARVTALLDAALAAHASWPEPSRGMTDLARLTRILKRSEFQWPVRIPSDLEQWLDNLALRIQDFLDNLLPDSIAIELPLVDLLVSLAAAVLLVLVFWYVASQLLAGMTPETRLDDPNGDDAAISAGQAFERAQTLSAAGDLRSAVRYLYLATLLTLDEQGQLRYDRTRTNREYLASVAQSPRLASTLGDVVDVFDRVWYGQQSLEPGAFARYSDLVKALRSGQ